MLDINLIRTQPGSSGVAGSEAASRSATSASNRSRVISPSTGPLLPEPSKNARPNSSNAANHESA